VEGPRWVKETHDYVSLPLLVRPNTVLPVGRHADRADYDYADGVTLRLYELEPETTLETSIPALEGEPTVFRTTRQGSRLRLERRGPAKAWNVLLVNIPAVKTVSAGEGKTTPEGVLVHLTAETSQVEVELSAPMLSF
jgi:alpha-D-xyloside xylohydrolase